MQEERSALLTVYVFRDNGFSPSGDTVVCVADKRKIESTFGREQFESLFFGSTTYRNDTTEEEYLGVWGERNASRFRQLLRDRGIEIQVQKARPPTARCKLKSTRPGQRTKLQRLQNT